MSEMKWNPGPYMFKVPYFLAKPIDKRRLKRDKRRAREGKMDRITKLMARTGANVKGGETNYSWLELEKK